MSFGELNYRTRNSTTRSSINSDSRYISKVSRGGSNVKFNIVESVNSGYLNVLVTRLDMIYNMARYFSAQNMRFANTTNYDSLISRNSSVHTVEEEIELRCWGVYPNRALLLNQLAYHAEGQKMQLQMNGNLTGYTDFYNLSCINTLYPISLTQNELVNFPVDNINILIQSVDKVLKEHKQKPLTLTDMIDHRIYHTDILCIIVNKTYGIDKRIVDNKETECLSCLLSGFCVTDGLTTHTSVVSSVCNTIEKIIKNANLKSNTALKYQSDIKLSDDNIQILSGKGSEFRVEDLTIKNHEIASLDYDYYPYLDVGILIEEFHNSSDRLLILHGNPGVGKSKLSSLISHRFLKEYKNNVIMLPGRHCTYSDAWSRLESEVETNSRNGKDTLVVIDDLDPLLLNRELPEATSGNVFFNSLITLLDGVISAGVKFVITTNHVIQRSEDSPLYRPGRLFDSILLKPLSLEEAVYLLKKNKVNKVRIDAFKKNKQEEYYQSFVAQYINDTVSNVKRSYYKGENKKVTKTQVSKIGF